MDFCVQTPSNPNDDDHSPLNQGKKWQPHLEPPVYFRKILPNRTLGKIKEMNKQIMLICADVDDTDDAGDTSDLVCRSALGKRHL